MPEGGWIGVCFPFFSPSGAPRLPACFASAVVRKKAPAVVGVGENRPFQTDGSERRRGWRENVGLKTLQSGPVERRLPYGRGLDTNVPRGAAVAYSSLVVAWEGSGRDERMPIFGRTW